MPQNASSGGKPAVLVIEDERALAEEIRYELQAEGYPVALAETRAEGLRVARAGGAAVLVVDRMLNHEDGLSILETLREHRHETFVLEAASTEQRENDEINARRFDRATAATRETAS